MVVAVLLISLLESPRRFTASAVGIETVTSQSQSLGNTRADQTSVPADGPGDSASEALPTDAPLLPGTPLPSPMPTVSPSVVPTNPPNVSTPVTTVGVIPTITPLGFRAPETAQPSFAPGIYVTGIRVPPNAKRQQPVRFTATFVNTTGQSQQLQWRIVVLDSSNKEVGQSSPFGITVPRGNSRWWRSFVPVNTRGGCITLQARAELRLEGKKWESSQNTDGSTPVENFEVC
jgi:hypothetical protein